MRNVLLTDLTTPELNSQLLKKPVPQLPIQFFGASCRLLFFSSYIIWGIEQLEIMLFLSGVESAEPPEERTPFPGSLIRNFHMEMPSWAVPRSKALVR
jgi:hypothetical protein